MREPLAGSGSRLSEYEVAGRKWQRIPHGLQGLSSVQGKQRASRADQANFDLEPTEVVHDLVDLGDQPLVFRPRAANAN